MKKESNAGKLIINRLKDLSMVDIVEHASYLEDVMIDILKAKGVSDITNTVFYQKQKIPPQILEYLNGNALVFLDESILEDSNGDENDRHLCIVPGYSFISVFSSFTVPLHSFLEFKVYKKYFTISEKDPSLSYIPFTLFCLEIFKNIEQKKITEIAIYLKKLKVVGSEKNYDWIRISSVFCGLLIFYAFDVEVDELDNSDFENDIRAVVNEEGDLSELFFIVDVYVNNPTKECRDKKRLENKVSDNFKESDVVFEKTNSKELSGLRLVFQDFLDVLLFWR